jgi:hypothetical protein
MIGFAPNFIKLEIDLVQSTFTTNVAEGAKKMTELTLLMAGIALLGHR